MANDERGLKIHSGARWLPIFRPELSKGLSLGAKGSKGVARGYLGFLERQ